jgi:molybdopterin-containing oxidoreductase family iron-sulfur binding subunit
MSRLYVVESRLSVTGMSADERLRARPSEVQSIAADVLASLLDLVPAAPPPAKVAAAARPRGPNRNWVQGVARDLLAHPGAALVVAGDAQPPAVHALAHAMNELLGAAGAAVTYGPSAIFEAGEESHGLGALGRAVDAGGVASLAIVGGNPAFTAAADLDLARRIASVPTSVYVGLHENETSWACRWFAPAAHFLESWGDAASFDGTPSIVQPLIRPLFDGRTVAQILAAYIGQPDAEPLALLRAYWNGRSPGDAQAFWERALVQGVVEGPAPPPVPPHVDWAAVAALLSSRPSGPPGGFEIAYYADSKVHDGRFAANPWLQELGDPVTKLTWDNAALVSPATASSLGVENEDVVELAVRGRTLRAPVLVLPGVADDTVAIALGYGGAIGTSVSPERVGANAYALRDSRAPWFDAASVRKVEGHWPLALTQEHWSMEGRPIALRHTLAGYRANPDFAEPMNEKPRLLYELAPSGKCQWGMTIDLNACTGCSACVVACYAENNLPVVGKGGVRLRREMDWLRIDRYFVGDADDPAVVTQPMLCQHCEAAPCEYVCPVNATVHSPDGLNEMVYNRCVGTRFCSNNCPYKVRRFNFFNYNVAKPPLEQLAMNPDVTVRDRGVMEKCTYCVQRIRETEIRAGREHRAIRDGEVLTACQQTCPTGAIAFGDIADPNTLVSGTRKNRRLYAVLHSLGTLPRTRYLARVVNPNPELRA